MSFFNSEVLPALGGWFRPLVGRDPYNKKSVEESSKAALKAVDVVEQHLLHSTYLAGERITLADLYAAGTISKGFQFVFGKEWRAANPNVTRWYETVYNQPIYSAVVDKLAFVDEPLKNQPPKKPEQPKQPKKEAAPKPKAKAVEEEEEEEEEAPAAPKPKHPLEALPKATLPLDEWKRQYSNNDTPDALKWFWEHYNAQEYSLWKVDYKYNDELTQVFMTSNLIGGFFARLEASRKYIFGCASVYGVKDDSIIQGAFVIRGQDALPAFDVAPDYESYEFTKLDPTKAEDKEFVNEQWTWEKPITVGGKEYPWADGKVFK
jgi:elongation factor 1-gamma